MLVILHALSLLTPWSNLAQIPPPPSFSHLFCPALCLRRVKFAAISMSPCELEHMGGLRVGSGVFFPSSAWLPQLSLTAPQAHVFCQVSLLPQLQLSLGSASSIAFLFLQPQEENSSPSVTGALPYLSLFLTLPLFFESSFY